MTNALQLRSLSKTRWSARAESVQAVWTSFEAIHDALLNIVGHSNIDNKTKGKATGIINQLLNFDFIVSIMFTRGILMTLRLLSDNLQMDHLNVMEPMTLLHGTVNTIRRVHHDDAGLERQVIINFTSDRYGIDVDAFFRRHHRPRNAPR